MILNELENNIRIPGYDLVGSYEAGVPTYRVKVKVQAQREQEVPTIARFALQLVQIGIDDEDEITKALGLDKEFTRNALEFLNVNNLIKRKVDTSGKLKFSFSITEKGEQSIRSTLAASFVTSFDIKVDGLTGELSRITEYSSLKEGVDLQKRGVFLLHAATGVRPTVESLSKDLKKLVGIYHDQQVDLENISELMEVLAVERLYLLYKPVNVLVFRNQQSEKLNLRTFEGYEPIPSYDQKLTQRERDGSKVIPDGLLTSASEFIQPSKIGQKILPKLETMERQEQQLQKLEEEKVVLEQSQKETAQELSVVTTRTQRILELEAELKTYRESNKKSRLIRSYEHFDVLKEAITTATEKVIVISPWIKRDAIDEDIVKLIRDAVRRGVWVIIGYGMPLREDGRDSKEKYADKWVMEQFEKIKKHPDGVKLLIEWLGNTHEKVLICDKRFCVVTSFNWLSYRGDRGFRRERGARFEDVEMIKEVYEDAINAFKALPDEFPKQQF
jgi:hypothetical protein